MICKFGEWPKETNSQRFLFSWIIHTFRLERKPTIGSKRGVLIPRFKEGWCYLGKWCCYAHGPEELQEWKEHYTKMTSQEEKGHVPDTRRTDVTSKYTVRTNVFKLEIQVSGFRFIDLPSNYSIPPLSSGSGIFWDNVLEWYMNLYEPKDSRRRNAHKNISFA